MRISDWSSDVCSSDLLVVAGFEPRKLRFAFGVEDRGVALFLLIIAAGDELDVVAKLDFMVELYGEFLVDDVGRGEDLFEDRSEEHTSELQSLMRISYAVFCLKKKKKR